MSKYKGSPIQTQTIRCDGIKWTIYIIIIGRMF